MSPFYFIHNTLIMESKFKPGDKVEVISSGHVIFISKLAGIPVPDGAKIIGEDETTYFVDIHPELVGKRATITGSYHDLYGGTDPRQYKIYSLSGIPEKVSWYNEEQLKLVED